jgi:hydroxyacylglutathione hydrolase
LQFENEDEFVKYILSEQPEAPKYFAVMKRVNRVGPEVLGEDSLPAALPVTELKTAMASGQVVDLINSNQFADGHISGSLNIPPKSIADWGGWLLDYERPVFLIAEPDQVKGVTRTLQKIGIDRIAGYFNCREVADSGLRTESFATATPSEIADRVERGEVTLIDVRSQVEWDAGHIPQAMHLFLGRLPKTQGQIPTDKPVLVQCRSGARSAVAASYLQAAGIKNVINLTGGITAWQNAQLPCVAGRTGQQQACSV